MNMGFVFEVSSRCNLSCEFCYNVWLKERKIPSELTTSRACDLLKRLFDSTPVSWLAFSGGEPLLRQDLEEIISFVKTHYPKIHIGIATNGTLLNKARCETLIQSGIEYFEVSLFAVEDSTYKKLTGQSYLSKVRQSLTHIKGLRAKLSVATLLSAQTIAHLEDTIEVAFALGADRLMLNRFIPTGRGSKNIDKFLPSINQLTNALKIANSKSKELDFPIIVSIPIEPCIIPHEQFPNLQFSSCSCGKYKWAIDSEGNLRTCEQNNNILGNLLTHSFAELSSKQSVREFRNFQPFKLCTTCQQRRKCEGGCRFK